MNSLLVLKFFQNSFFVKLLSFAALLNGVSCSNLQSTGIFSSNVYSFPGAENIRLQPNGSYVISWEKVPTSEIVKYVIFSRRESEKYNFLSPDATTTEVTHLTAKLAWNENTCFVVRANAVGLSADQNQREVCTKATKFSFSGAASLQLTEKGTYLVSWKAVPIPESSYLIYEFPEGSVENFDLPFAVTTDTRFESKSYSPDRNICYIVRFISAGIGLDLNTNKKCTSNQALTPFVGILSADSVATGVVDISWTKTLNPDIIGYRIYEGANFETLKKSIAADRATAQITGLAADSNSSFGVRAFDKYGREDSNRRTLSVTVVNNLAPQFSGVLSSSFDSGSVTVRWQEGSGGIHHYNIYSGTTARGISASLESIDFSKPLKVVNGPALSTTIQGLGDDLAHHFVVRAAVSGGAEEENIVVKKVELPDNGPPVFEGIKAVAFEGGQIKVTWDGAKGQTSKYRVYVSSGDLSYSAGDLKAEVSDSLREAIITGIPDNRAYKFAVRAVDLLNQSDSNTKTLALNLNDLTPPTFLGYISATALDENRIRLLFKRSLEPDVVRYSIRARATGSNQNLVEIASVNQTASEDLVVVLSGLLGSTSYDFLVKSIDTSGNVSSNSDFLTRNTLDFTPPTFAGVASVVKNLVDTANPRVQINWIAPSAGDAQEFKVYYSKSSLGAISLRKTESFPKVLPSGQIIRASGNLSDSTTSINLPISSAGLEQGTAYFFVVHAIDSAGNEDSNSVQIEFVVPNVTPPVFAGLTSVAQGNSGSNSTLLTWPLVPGASEYLIYSSIVAGSFPTNPTAIVSAPITEYSFTELSDYSTYYYRVRARNVEGFQDTNTVDRSYFVPDRSPPVFSGLNAIDINGATAKLDLKFPSATDNQGVKEYLVFWRAAGGDFPASPLKTVTALNACTAAGCSIGIGTSDGLIVNVSYDFRVDVRDTNLPIANVRTSATIIGKSFPSFATPSGPTFLGMTPFPVNPTKNTAPTIAGEAATGLTVKVFVDGVEKGSQLINSGTTFSIVLDLTESLTGDKVISARTFNAFGVGSGSVNIGIYPLDVTPPAITLVSAVTPSIIGGSSATIKTAGLSFQSGEAASFLLLDGAVTVASGSVVANAVRTLTFEASSLAAGDGLHAMSLVLSDIAGNSSIQNLSIGIDTTPPNSPRNFFAVRDEEKAEMRLSWENPSLVSTDYLMIRSGATAPVSASTGLLLAGSLPSTATTYTSAGFSQTALTYAVFACDFLGNCSNVVSCVSCKVTFSTSLGYTNLNGYNNVVGFGWNVVGSGLQRVAQAHTKAILEGWRGEDQSNSSAGVVVYSAGTSPCAEASCNFNYSTANNGGPYPPWKNLHFRLAIVEANSNAVTLAKVKRWAQVPPGMVFIAKEEWPKNMPVSGSSSSLIENYSASETFDFAIDQVEASTVTGVADTEEDFSQSVTTFPNSNTTVLRSMYTAKPDKGSWFAFKQGCLNRTYDAFYTAFTANDDLLVGDKGTKPTPNALRKFHLMSGIEFMIASYGTIDAGGEGNCNIDNRGMPAIPSETGVNSSVCISKFGARHFIGNAEEMTDEYLISGKRGTWERYFGTTDVGSLISADSLPDSDNGTWNFSKAMRVKGTVVDISGDSYGRVIQSSSNSTVEGGGLSSGSGATHGWVAYRGGRFSHLAGAGRFALALSRSPISIAAGSGGRCAILAPTDFPKITSFGNESVGSSLRLHWNSSNYENGTVFRLGSSSSKTDLNAWTGGSSGTNISVETDFSSCSNSSYTPSSSTLHTGKYCGTISNAKYFKICAENPAIDGVSSTPLCSQITYVDPVLNAPNLDSLLQAGRSNLQNDSVGSVAAFYWKKTGVTANISYRLAYGANYEEIKRWQGEESRNFGDTGAVLSLTSGPAGSARSTCNNVFGTGEHYSPPSGLFDGTDFDDYACVNLASLPKWSKRFFRLAVTVTDGNGTPSSWHLSDVQAAGNAPEGMVLVARELWPSLANGNVVNEHPASTFPYCVGRLDDYPSLDYTGLPDTNGKKLHNCRYDYAIDKFEPTLFVGAGTLNTSAFASGGTTIGQNATTWAGRTNNTANTTTRYNVSPKNHAVATASGTSTFFSPSWYVFKKLCENRIASTTVTGYVGSNTITKPRLATSIEWTVAALDTPDLTAGNDTYCNISSGALANSGSKSKCVSRFGTYDQIGNLWEFVDEISFNRTTWERFYGTSSVINPHGTVTFPSVSGFVSVWNYISGFLTDIAALGSDAYYASFTASETTNPANGGQGGVGWSIIRGGNFGLAAGAGRFAIHVGISPSGPSNMSGRCSIAAP